MVFIFTISNTQTITKEVELTFFRRSQWLVFNYQICLILLFTRRVTLTGLLDKYRVDTPEPGARSA